MSKTVIFNFADGPKEIGEGYTFFYKDSYSRRDGELMTVVSVGRAYVTCQKDKKFCIETGYYQSNLNPSRAWSSEEAYKKYQLTRKYSKAMIEILNSKSSEISIEQWEIAAQALGVSKELHSLLDETRLKA